MLVRFRDGPEPPPPGMLQPGFEIRVMHATARIADSVELVSDGCGPGPGFAGFSLSLQFSAVPEADRSLDALAAGGTVQMPMDKTFWSPRFSMVTDRFGLGWMITVVAGSPK